MKITEGLPGKYTAVQMHLHWGGWDLEASGAEHTIDGIRYMAESLQLHGNTVNECLFPPGCSGSQTDGYFENTYYSDFIANLEKIKRGVCVTLTGQYMNISHLDVRSMLPENLNHFFRYQGSLTTPPCYESILWTVFDNIH
ncbi:carbonic anhydrase 6 [Oreochromis niloticus]|uniref:carbonic anhydrase 6 n=1 Tax=Oreochromis niloticus TaxID=8128 RepID=UPI000DF123A5|nr:carbonic anhydrase 6-like [Oreochromis niloticus]CAI5647296.1 unnamed protein product [Mustela putorius furo]